MRVYAETPEAMRLYVYFNGEKLRNVIEADDRDGYIIRLQDHEEVGEPEVKTRVAGLVQFLSADKDPEPIARDLFSLSFGNAETWETETDGVRKEFMVYAIRAIQLGAELRG